MIKSPSKYTAVLLDWDDTIGDWIHAAASALQDIYNQHNLIEFYPEFEDFVQTYSTHNQELWHRYGKGEVTKEFLQVDRFLYPLLHALELTFAPQPLVQLAETISREFLLLTNKYFSLLPGAADFVRYLSSRYRVAILSNGFKEAQYPKLEQSGLAEYFDAFIISEEVGVNKPNPEIYEIALKQLGVTKEETIMVGDSYFSDISGAIEAGIDQIWIAREAPQEGQTATYIVPNLQAVYDIL